LTGSSKEEKRDWPQKVELLLHRQGPKVSQIAVQLQWQRQISGVGDGHEQRRQDGITLACWVPGILDSDEYREQKNQRREKSESAVGIETTPPDSPEPAYVPN
jgi:hypothetical protein